MSRTSIKYYDLRETDTPIVPMFNSIHDLIIQGKANKPIFCFSPAVVQERVQLFKNGFPGIVSWAVKSNPHPHVLGAVVKVGVTHFDVASEEEVNIVQMACPNAVMHFNHPVKSPEDIGYAWVSGVRSFAVDCVDEVEKIHRVFTAKGISEFSAITLLVRFYDRNITGSSHYNFNAKFGASPAKAAALLTRCQELGFKVGLTFHTGSQNSRPETYRMMMHTARDIVISAFQGRYQKLDRLNIGGGFPCPYPGGDNPPISDYFREIQLGAVGHTCEIMCEPGRFFVAEAASLLTRITLRRQGEGHLYINDGIYGSFRESSYVPLIPPCQSYNADGMPISKLKASLQPFQIWGPTCDSLDQLPGTFYLPSSIQTGDFIEWGMMGAYTIASTTQFNGFQPPQVVQIKSLGI
jgi:ornithine decarboxylase